MMCSVRLILRLPARDRRCRCCSPEDASNGAVPFQDANRSRLANRWMSATSASSRAALWFQQMDAPRPQRNRIHVDISVPHDLAEARVAAAIAAGGRLVSDRNAPAWWALADAEGNEVDVATWMGRE
ncbi:hypothetical protein ILP97_24905 [Amycolatopsis sp. H6(2020)]|nr:hypothetical protein [Amycolatopsis sp. H6(2020)]